MAGPQRMRTRQGIRLWTVKQAPFLQGGGIPSWSFDPDAATFTAKMSKRNAPGTYGAAPIVQGRWDNTGVPDIIKFPDGTQIDGNFFANVDMHQGAVSFLITPEWDGDDNKTHWILDFGYNDLTIYKRANNTLRVLKNSAPTITGAAVGISDWTAGTTYFVVIRWDGVNTLDGTNHVCISINDVHTFSTSTAPATGNATPNANIPIGSRNNADGANARITNLIVHRRPLFDGTYGIDAGRGDEINLMYTQYLWTKLLTYIGSWDICFCMPTNGVQGELVTGSSDAWSHPHKSNLLGVGGFMFDGTYGNDGWSDEGSPTAVAALAAAEKIYHGGYKVTSDAANEGIYKDYTCTAGDHFVIRALAHSDGTSIPKLIMYDQTNTTEIGSLTGSTGSTRSAPDILLFTGTAPAGCTTIRVKLINTDATASDVTYWHQCELLTSVVRTPSFEGTFDDESGGGGGTVNIAPDWKNAGLETDGTDTADKETTIVHSGGSSQYLDVSIAGEGIRNETEIFTRYLFYSIGCQTYFVSGANIQVYCPGYASNLSKPVGEWVQSFMVGLKTTANDDFNIRSRHNATEWYTDDVYGIALDHVTLTVTPASEANAIESAGTRVSGRSTLTQAISTITATSGKVSFNCTPRRSSSQFEIYNPIAFLCYLYKDANNFIQVHSESNTALRLDSKIGGVDGNSANYDASALFAVNTTYLIEIEYSATEITFSVDGDVKITITRSVDFGANIPDVFHAGSDSDGIYQIDAVFGAPT